MHAVLFDVPTEVAGQAALGVAARLGARAGALLAASHDARHGVPDTSVSTEGWVAACRRLVDAGASIIGGGAGTTLMHLSGLSQAFGKSDTRLGMHAGVAASQVGRQTSSE